MIAELFLTCALALPVTAVHHPSDNGGTNESDKQAFLREWKWLHDLLERQYPDHEFLIIPVQYEETPPGWTWVPFGWRGHLIYKRPISGGA